MKLKCLQIDKIWKKWYNIYITNFEKRHTFKKGLLDMKKRNFTLTFFVALSFVAILAIIGFIIYRETGLEVTHEENNEYVVVEGDRLNFYDIQPYVFEPW